MQARTVTIQYSVKLWLMICDAPARAYLKCTKSHTGYYACERCVVEGDYDGRMVFHEINSASRTNDKFNSMEYLDDHQKGSSPFVEVGFPCVTNFVIDSSMGFPPCALSHGRTYPIDVSFVEVHVPWRVCVCA